MSLRCSRNVLVNVFSYIVFPGTGVCVNCQEPDTTLYRLAIEMLRTPIHTPTSPMNSVPKLLKFLCLHYDGLEIHADILAVLAMTYQTV